MRYTLAGLLLLVGCAADSGPELLAGFDPGPAPDNGMQIVLDPVRDIQPGESREICTYTDVKTDAVVDVRALQSFQATGGHHVALYISKVASPSDKSHVCTDADMVNLRFVAASGSQGQVNEAPGQLVYRIPAGSTLVLQQHYINTTSSAIDSQAALNLIYADPGQSYTPSSGLAFVDTDLHLAPGVDTADIACTMQQDIKAWFAIPHMHRYGTSISVTHTHAGTTDTIFDLPEWDAGFEFHAPEQRWDVADPMVFAAGDQVNVHCEWNNTTQDTLVFGNEMCVFFAETIDDSNQGNIDCNNGDWGNF